MDSAHRGKLQRLAVGRAFFWFGFAITYLGGLSAAAGTSTQVITGVFAFVGGSLLTFSGFRRPIRNAIAVVRNSPTSPEARSADGDHPSAASQEGDGPRASATSEKPENAQPSLSSEQHAMAETPQSAAPPEHVDATRMSVALGGFSTGLIAGAPSGIALRLLGSALILRIMPIASGPEVPNPLPSSAPVASTAVHAEYPPTPDLDLAVSTAEPEQTKESAPASKLDVAHQTLTLFAMQSEEVEQCLQIARNVEDYRDAETKAMIKWLWRHSCCHDERLATHTLCGDVELIHK